MRRYFLFYQCEKFKDSLSYSWIFLRLENKNEQVYMRDFVIDLV
jgi:hypothetical protein